MNGKQKKILATTGRSEYDRGQEVTKRKAEEEAVSKWYMSMNHKRAMAGSIAALVLVIVLFSAVYLTVESHHDCSGEGCPVCAALTQCEHQIRQIGGAALATALVVTVSLFGAPSVFSIYSHILLTTPVKQKVRLNH